MVAFKSFLIIFVALVALLQFHAVAGRMLTDEGLCNGNMELDCESEYTMTLCAVKDQCERWRFAQKEAAEEVQLIPIFMKSNA